MLLMWCLPTVMTTVTQLLHLATKWGIIESKTISQLLSWCNLQYVMLLSILHTACLNTSNVTQLNAFSAWAHVQSVHGAVSGASVLLDKYLEIVIVYKNKHEYITEYDSSAWVKHFCHNFTHTDFLFRSICKNAPCFNNVWGWILRDAVSRKDSS